MSAMQLATNKRLRWPADNVTFSGGNACELTKFLLPLVANRSLPVRRSSNGVLLQIDDGPGYTLALVTSEIKGCQGNISRNEQTAERARDRKSTRLNSSHGYISYAVFCLTTNKT